MTHSYVTWLIHMWHDSCICDVMQPCGPHSYLVMHQHSRHDYSYVTWFIHTWHDSSICDMTYSYVMWLTHIGLTHISWCINIFDMTIRICNITTHSNTSWLIHMWHDSFTRDVTHPYVIWLIHTWRDSSICDMTHSHVTWLIRMWHDSFTRDVTNPYVTWLIHTWRDSSICDMTYSYVTWLIHMWYDSFIRDVTHPYVTWLIHTWRDSSICDMTHSYVTWLIYMWHGSFIWAALIFCDASIYVDIYEKELLVMSSHDMIVMPHSHFVMHQHIRHDYSHLSWSTYAHDMTRNSFSYM